MAYSVEFRRLRAGRPFAGDGVDFFGFTALSRGVRLMMEAVAPEEPDRQEQATDGALTEPVRPIGPPGMMDPR
jgi:hypothetical protein